MWWRSLPAFSSKPRLQRYSAARFADVTHAGLSNTAPARARSDCKSVECNYDFFIAQRLLAAIADFKKLASERRKRLQLAAELRALLDHSRSIRAHAKDTRASRFCRERRQLIDGEEAL